MHRSYSTSTNPPAPPPTPPGALQNTREAGQLFKCSTPEPCLRPRAPQPPSPACDRDATAPNSRREASKWESTESHPKILGRKKPRGRRRGPKIGQKFSGVSAGFSKEENHLPSAKYAPSPPWAGLIRLLGFRARPVSFPAVEWKASIMARTLEKTLFGAFGVPRYVGEAFDLGPKLWWTSFADIPCGNSESLLLQV